MASYQKSSHSNRKLVFKVLSSSSPKLPPTPSQSPPPPPPPPPAGITMKFPLVYHRSSSLSPELALLYDQVFTALPQTPHFNPLAELSDNIKEGVKMGYDVAFMNLVTKFHDFVDGFTVLSEVGSYIKQLKEFEDMGYDLTKLRERLNLLITRAEVEKLLKDEVEKLEVVEKDAEAKIETQEFRLMELAKEYAKLEKAIDMKRSEMESVSRKKRKIMDDSKNNLNALRKLANNPW